MIFNRDVETNSVSLRLRKPYSQADLSSHTVLTDDVFSYVDFYFKTHKKNIKRSNGKVVEQNHLFYWAQAKNFYNATKVLPIEAAPLPMYYCMLNAVKAYLIYKCKIFDDIENDFRSHGLQEANSDVDGNAKKLSEIYVKHFNYGVFSRFGKDLMGDMFNDTWRCSNDGAMSVQKLLYYLPFVHSAYISTYKLPRNKEHFIPLKSGTTPTFRFTKSNKIYLVAELDKSYFKQNAVTIPEEIKNSLPDGFAINIDNGFELVSKESLLKKDVKFKYDTFRKSFSYITGNKRIWYLNRNNSEISDLNTMIIEIALAHRFSEIVRYKPEQMVKLLQGKENWLIHEFLSLALDQFMDEIACQITKQEIMTTRNK